MSYSHFTLSYHTLPFSLPLFTRSYLEFTFSLPLFTHNSQGNLKNSKEAKNKNFLKKLKNKNKKKKDKKNMILTTRACCQGNS